MSSQPSVFVSYPHDAHIQAAYIREGLENRGFKVWTDRDITPGAKWSPAIDDQISRAFALIVIVTSQTIDSDYVTYEWSFALGKELLVIPTVFEKNVSMHAKLKELQWIDYSNEGEGPWKELEAILSSISQEPKSSSVAMQNERLVDLLTDLLATKKIKHDVILSFKFYKLINDQEIRRILNPNSS